VLRTLWLVPNPADVALRAQSPEDEAVLFRLYADLDTWEERTPRSPAPLSLPTFRERLARGELTGEAEFVITVDGEAVGRCTIFGEDQLARHAEVGIALLPDFGFRRRNLRRLHLVAIESNAAGIAVYRKVGFVEEGRRREHCWVRGRYEDEVIMGLLRSDWEAIGGPISGAMGA
jgi:RimJ/RimL family protein N-acetyltransferase